MTTTMFDEAFLLRDDADELRAAAAVLRRRSRNQRGLRLRFLTALLERIADILEHQAR